MKYLNQRVRSIVRRQRSSRAQAMVEFALVLPLLLLLLIGIIDLGRALFVYSQVSNATREAARYAANTDVVNPSTRRLDCASIAARARSMFSMMPNTLNITVTIERPSGTGFTYVACADPTTSGRVQNGDRVRVETRATVDMFTLQMISGLMGGRLPGTWPINFTSSRTLLPVGGISTGPTTTPMPFGSGGGVGNWYATQTQVALATQSAATATSAAATATSVAATATSAAATVAAQPTPTGTPPTPTHTPTAPIVTPTGSPTPTPVATSTTPGQPGDFSVASVKCNGQFDIEFNWTAPTTGGTVAYYRIFDSSTGTQVGTDIMAPATSVTIKNLITSGQTRTFYIIAFSAAGVGGTPSDTDDASCGAPTPTNTPVTPTLTPTATPTASGPTATPTPTASGPTATPLPTPCAITVAWFPVPPAGSPGYPARQTTGGSANRQAWFKARVYCTSTGSPISSAEVSVINNNTLPALATLQALTTPGDYGDAGTTNNCMGVVVGNSALSVHLYASYTLNGVTVSATTAPDVTSLPSASACP